MKIVSPFLSLFEIYNGMLLTPAQPGEPREPQLSPPAHGPAEATAAEIVSPALTLAANS